MENTYIVCFSHLYCAVVLLHNYRITALSFIYLLIYLFIYLFIYLHIMNEPTLQSYFYNPF